MIDPWGHGLVTTAEGGFVFTGFSRVRLVGPGLPDHVALAMTALRHGGSAPVVAFRSNGDGAVRAVVLTARGRPVARRSVRSGAGSIQLPRVPPGRYRVRLTLETPDARRASTAMAVVIGGTLPVRVARHVIKIGLGDETEPWGPGAGRGECRRMSARRVDCKGYWEADCDLIGAATLRAGFTYVRSYGCKRGFQRRPRWTDPASPWPPLGAVSPPF